METGLAAEGAIDRIDWSAPWLEDFRELGAPLIGGADWFVEMNRLAQSRELRNCRNLPVNFVPQKELPAGMPYEAFIADTGKVPTRINLHDFFNALAWIAYPRLKRQLNALQSAEIAKSAALSVAPAGRGKLRDGATIFDENAALFISADAEMIAALCAHQWQDLFVARRSVFDGTCRVRLFGHALMEKLTSPYKAITAHAWVVQVEPAFFALPTSDQRVRLDDMLAQQLANGLSTVDFAPLPVLGVPGWWPDQDAAFYADRNVFRPRRADA